MSSGGRISLGVLAGAVALASMLAWGAAHSGWTGSVLIWPASGNGLVVGWTQTGFSSRDACKLWLHGAVKQTQKFRSHDYDILSQCQK